MIYINGQKLPSLYIDNKLYTTLYFNGKQYKTSSDKDEKELMPGYDWERVSGLSNFTINKIIYNGVFIAVGNGGSIITSQDGINWTVRNSGTTDNLNSIAYNNGVYVAVGAGGRIVRSTDGINWSSATVSGISVSLTDIATDSNIFIAVATDGYTTRSTDGINWINSSSAVLGTTTNLNRYIDYGNGKWVAVRSSTTGGQNSCYFSTDGSAWTSITFTVTQQGTLNGIKYIVNRFIVFSRTANISSFNSARILDLGNNPAAGTTPTLLNSGFNIGSDLNGILFYEDQLLAAGNNGVIVISAKNNLNSWSVFSNPPSSLIGNANLYSAAYSNNRLVIGGDALNSSALLFTSPTLI